MADASDAVAVAPLLLELAMAHQCRTGSSCSTCTFHASRPLQVTAGFTDDSSILDSTQLATQTDGQQHSNDQVKGTEGPSCQPAAVGLSIPISASDSPGQKAADRLVLLQAQTPARSVSRHRRPTSRFASSATGSAPQELQPHHNTTAAAAGALRSRAMTTFLANSQAAAAAAGGALSQAQPAAAAAAAATARAAVGRAVALQAIDTGMAQPCRADLEELLLARWTRRVGRQAGNPTQRC